VATRSEESPPTGDFGAAHYRALHHHLFQDLYAWAGEYRTVRIAKGDSMFCYPEHIAAEMEHLFAWLAARNALIDVEAEAFAADAAHFLATLNAIHPFREGNGRTQLAFLAMLAAHAGYPLNLQQLDPATFLDAMIRSFAGDEAPLAQQLARLI
jgi:cell filamentation protein